MIGIGKQQFKQAKKAAINHNIFVSSKTAPVLIQFLYVPTAVAMWLVIFLHGTTSNLFQIYINSFSQKSNFHPRGIATMSMIKLFQVIIASSNLRTLPVQYTTVRVRIFTYVPSLMYDHIRCPLHGTNNH